jgi:hypothetical protein
MLDDPAQTRGELTPPCLELHALHPDQSHLIGECAFELTWLAAVVGDPAAARQMVEVLAHTSTDASDDTRQLLTRAYRLLLDRDLAGARSAIERARPAVTDSSPWWTVIDAFDTTVASILVNEAAGRRAQAVDDLEQATRLLARVATAIPPGPLHRRQRTLDTLRARVRP